MTCYKNEKLKRKKEIFHIDLCILPFAESEFPTFLHFCSKYGNELCVKWCKKNDPNFKQACIVEDKAGKTPEQLAIETQQTQSVCLQILIIKIVIEKAIESYTSVLNKITR